MLTMRKYQEEILSYMNIYTKGSYIINVATGLGKTVIFTEFINQHPELKILVLAHREELIQQPIKYIKHKVGIEQAENKAIGNENIIIACVPTLFRRLEKYPTGYFDVIITDECHHAPCDTYQKIYQHFKPRLHFGFTATVNRADNVRLDKIFQKILYEKNLLSGIKEGYLSNIHCLRFYMNYDLTKCRIAKGDYQVSELEKYVDTIENSQAIARIYNNHAIGSTLIFGVSVAHCESIQKEIPNSVLITAKTQNREQIIKDFTDGKIKCLINCMVFTEGIDIPKIETIIIARPTKNQSLYTQMVGRGLRLFEGKEKLLLIDCCGVTNNGLCSAPTLLGIDMIPQKKKPMTRDDLIEGNLFDLPEIIQKEEDKPFNWIINHKVVDIFAKKLGITLHGINFFKMPNGDLTLKFSSKNKERKVNILIPAPDSLGHTSYAGKKWNIQELIDRIYVQLNNKYPEERMLWDLEKVKRWGRGPITENQSKIINRMLPHYKTTSLSKLEATFIINRLFNKRR